MTKQEIYYIIQVSPFWCEIEILKSHEQNLNLKHRIHKQINMNLVAMI